MDNNSNKNIKKSNPHKDHRKRLKKHFLQEGLSSFPHHNVLELLLFYSLPQKDTNEIAHALIEKFGSFSAVFDANFEDLCTVSGISEHSATLIKLIPEIAAAYSLDKLSAGTDFSNIESATKYLIEYFMPKTTECVVAIFLDSKNSLLHISEISSGIVNMTQVEIRKIAELAFLYNASGFIISHNHPKGKAKASREDVAFTMNTLHTFEKLGINMIEHIVIAGNKSQCILRDVSKLQWS